MGLEAGKEVGGYEMSALLQDVRYGLKVLWKNRGITLVAALVLALGIGANSAIFSIVNALLLRTLPFEKSEQIVMVWEKRARQGSNETPVTAADFHDWREQNQSFEQLAAFNGASFTLTSSDQPEQYMGANVTSNFFSALGVKPMLGRAFSKEEEQPGSNHVVIMSYGLWQRRFGSDPNIINRQVALNGETYTVVGVMPTDFEFFDRDINWWSPLSLKEDELLNRGLHFLVVVGRLKQSVTLAQARADMETIASRLEQQYPDKNAGHGVNLIPINEQFSKDYKTILLILQFAVGFVLLIACANVANLLLSGAAKRQKEIAIRTALGATRLRLIRQLLTESVVLSLLGGLLSLILALRAISLIKTIIPEATNAIIPGWDKIGLDARVFGFTLLVSVLTGMLFGLAPAIYASKVDLNESLKEGTKGSAGSSRHRVRNILVISEIALALMLLIGAGLMIKSFQLLQHVNPGFETDNLLTMELPLSEAKYPTLAQQVIVLQQFEERINSIQGVKAAGLVFALPLSGHGASRTFTIEGQPPPTPTQEPRAGFNAISPTYLRAMGIPLLKGETFTQQDLLNNSNGKVIINSTLAQRYWPNEEPLGRRLKIGGAQSKNPWLTVIGVAGDVKHIGLDSDVKSEIYVPITQAPAPLVALVVRTASDPTKLVADVRNQIQSIDKDQPIGNIKTMNQVLAEAVAQPRLYTILIGIFAGLALLLAVLGIYSMMAYSVVQRTQEIGIRMALGAQPRDILRLVLSEGMRLTLIGVAIGLVGSFVVTRLISSLLFGVSATDPVTFIAVTSLSIVIALIASYVPARRATKVDPMIALRYE